MTEQKSPVVSGGLPLNLGVLHPFTTMPHPEPFLLIYFYLLFLDTHDSRVYCDTWYLRGVPPITISIPFSWLNVMGSYMGVCSDRSLGKFCPTHPTVFPIPLPPPFYFLRQGLTKLPAVRQIAKCLMWLVTALVSNHPLAITLAVSKLVPR